MRSQNFIECGDDVGEFEFLGFLGCRVKVFPEVAEQLFPGQFARRDFVEFLLEVRGEVIFDIVLEEA